MTTIWTVTGQYSWSRTFAGKQSILNDLHGYVRTRLAERTRTIAHRFIADDDFVVVEAKGNNVTREGVRYDNGCTIAWCFGWKAAGSGRSGNTAIPC